MDRRTFFKGMFSAAVVAAIPKPIFDTIVAAPSEPEFKKLCSIPNSNGLFIFDGEKLLTWTSIFAVGYKQHRVNKSCLEDVLPYTTYEPGLKEWKILASDLNLTETSPKENYFFKQKLLKAVMKYQDVEFYGDVLLTEASIQCPMDDVITYSATFTGCGALIRTI